jgi:hypothetical protein
MQNNWKEITETSKDDPEYYVTRHIEALIQYATFLQKVNWDYGESGRKIAEEAEKMADKSNHVIMRNLAEFYIQSAKHNTKILEKAENILDGILEAKPNCARTLRVRGLLFFDKYRFAAKDNKEKYFSETKTCLYTSWQKTDKKDVSPALDLVHIYQQKYEDTGEDEIVIDVENLFREIFKDLDKLHDSSKALVHEEYGAFLKTHSKALILSHLKKSFQYRPQTETTGHDLWDLARDLVLSSDSKDQIEGTKVLGWMNELLMRRDGEGF